MFYKRTDMREENLIPRKTSSRRFERTCDYINSKQHVESFLSNTTPGQEMMIIMWKYLELLVSLGLSREFTQSNLNAKDLRLI